MEYNLSTLSINVRRQANTKIDQIIYHAQKQNANIILLQETCIISPKTKHKIQTTYDLELYENPGTIVSRGVAILISKNLNQYVTKHQNWGTETGRITQITLNINNINLNITNIYAPASKDTTTKNEFYQELFRSISRTDTIIGGDYNCVLDPKTDVQRPREMKCEYTKTPSALRNGINTYNFTEIWREKNPRLFQYTYQAPVGTKTRIDYFLVPKIIRQNIQSCKIIKNTFSDHDGVLINLKLPNKQHKKTPWKLNNKLLDDPNICQDFKIYWGKFQQNKINQDHHQWWDMGKKRIQEFFRVRGEHNSRKNKTREALLRTTFERLSDIPSPNANTLGEIAVIQEELDQIDQIAIDGIKTRARVQDGEEGEKSTAFFYQKHQQNILKKSINALKDENNISQTGQQMMDIIHKHYYNLYEQINANTSQEQINNYLAQNTNTINTSLQDEIGALITYEEAYKALNKMHPNKSPGPDGLTREFYIKFWETIGNDVIEVLNNSYRKSLLPPSTRTAQVTLIYKKGDPENIGNWRPISLLNLDLKILSKSITERIKPHLKDIIHHDQTCGIKGRNIHDHLNFIKYLIDYVENNGEHRGGITILSIDQKQAFDRQEHPYMIKCLQSFGFGENLIQWVKTLYNGANSYCMVNGEKTKPFYLNRGVRQGCGLSMLLFIISLEPFLIKIRKNNNINGFRLTNGTATKQIAYADDVSFMINNAEEIKETFREFKRYGDLSGATINMAKTEILQIGNHNHNNIPETHKKYIKTQIKTLGLIIARSGIYKLNYENTIKKITNLSDFWKNRQLTLYGKVLILNSSLLCQLWYKMKTLQHIPPATSKKINSIIFKFLWYPNHTENTNRKTLRLPPIKGGLNIIDIDLRAQAYILQQIPLVLNAQPPKPWMILFGYYHDYFMSNNFNTPHLSNTHADYIDTPHNKLHILYNTHKSHLPNTNWKKTTLKSIYKDLQEQQTHTPTIQTYTYKTSEQWESLYKAQAYSNAPNYMKEINYKLMHNNIETKHHYKHKFQPDSTDTCRHCLLEPETTQHILTKCYPTAYNTLKNKIGNTHSIPQLLLQDPPLNNNTHLLYSIYRTTLLQNHLQLNYEKHKTDIEITHKFNIKTRKYKYLFKPP